MSRDGKRLGGRIGSLRKARVRSPEELADRFPIPRTSVGSVERGERNVSILNLRLIAKVLRVPLAELFVEPARKGRSR